MKKALKLQEHKHTAKILHHKHTSYRGLFVVMLVFGLSLVLIGKSASAADYVLNARVAAPLPTIAAQITAPANNSTVSTPNIVISGTCPIVTPAIIVVLYRADVMLGSAGCSADGKFAGTYNLAEGNNLITPKISTITLDAGPVGNAIKVTYAKAVPAASPSSVNTKPTPATSVQPTPISTPTPAPTNSLQITSTTPVILYRQNQSVVWKINVGGGETPYTILVDWGDGTKETFTTATAGEQTLEHVYKKSINTVVRASVKDATGREVYTTVAGVTSTAVQAPEVFGASKLAERSGLPLVQLWVVYGMLLVVLASFWYKHHHSLSLQTTAAKQKVTAKSRKSNKRRR